MGKPWRPKAAQWRALALVPLLLIAGLLAGCGGSEKEESPSVQAPAAVPPAAATADPAAGEVVKVINKDPGGSGKYEFSPSEITVNGGQKVTFELTSETEFHTFTVEDLDIDETLGSGETVKLEFTFDRAGEFELKCLAHPQMTGLITVQQARSALHETRPSAS